MSRKLVMNLIFIVVLFLSFPLLWLFNQRLNYRKFLTLKTKFSLDANTLERNELSSVTYIKNYLDEEGVSADFTVDVHTREPFKVLGRELVTPEGSLEVFEYSSNSDASKRLDYIKEEFEFSEDVYLYKNLLIYNKDQLPEIANLLKGLQNEEVD